MLLTPENPIDPEMRQRIEEVWKSRAQTQNLNPKSLAYKKAEVEFFVGATAALNQFGVVMPPKWFVNILSGRPVV